MTTLRLLAPAACLSAFAFLLFGVDAWTVRVSERSKNAAVWISLLGLIGAATLLVAPASAGTLFGRGMLIWDGLAYFFSWIALLTLMMVVLLSVGYRPYQGLRLGSYLGLLLLAGVGLTFLAASNDFLMIFISIELIGIPSFILAGFLRDDERSGEAAIKFFLIGAFSSAMLAYGISLLYGLTGTTSLTGLHQQIALLQAGGKLAFLALSLVLVSFGFKIALVPFHMWVPDVFEGAPVPIAGFLSVAPKMAGAAVLLRVFGLTFPTADLNVLTAIAAIAALTMTVGNVVALQQKNVVRLLAYSSIAHMGYLMLGFVGGGDLGVSGMYLYAWVYLFMSLGAFAVVIAVNNAIGAREISDYAGLAQRSPMMAALLSLFLLSLAGIPPTAGFIAKFYIFAAAFRAGWVWLVILAVINTVISVAYYFKIMHAMYFQDPPAESPIGVGLPERLALAVASFFTLILGLLPHVFVNAAQVLSGVPRP